MGYLVQSPLGHKPFGHIQARLYGGLHQSLRWLVDKRQLELGVYVCFVGEVGALDDLREVAERGDDRCDVVLAHPPLAARRADLGLGGSLSKRPSSAQRCFRVEGRENDCPARAGCSARAAGETTPDCSSQPAPASTRP
jgi:hypothetical protein